MKPAEKNRGIATRKFSKKGILRRMLESRERLEKSFVRSTFLLASSRKRKLCETVLQRLAFQSRLSPNQSLSEGSGGQSETNTLRVFGLCRVVFLGNARRVSDSGQ